MRQAQTLAVPLTPRGVALGVAGAALTALAVGMPTAVIPNPYFTRMTPTRPQDYAFLALTALLAGVSAATYATPRAECSAVAPSAEGRATAGGLLSFLAIGCPICNKLVVLALGASGALRYFEPVQPLLGAASLALLGATAWARLRAVREGCTRCAR